MIKRLSADVRKILLTSATEEARRRGDRRIGTDHLLLGLLHDANSPAARALGVDLAAGRAASNALDLAALAAVGLNVARLGDPSQPVHARGHLSLSSGARAVFVHAVEQARGARTPRIEARHFLLALLARERPDPAAELLGALGVDPSQVRSRLDGPSK